MTHQFETFRSWRIVGWCRIKQFVEGAYGILYIWLFWGLLSIFIFIGKQIEAFCRRETVAAFIIGIALFLIGWGWIATYTYCKAEAVTAQYIADSLYYELSKYIKTP